MSITKSGIVQIFTSNKHHTEIQTRMKRLSVIKEHLQLKKYYMLEKNKHAKDRKQSKKTKKQIRQELKSKRLQKFKVMTQHLQTIDRLQTLYESDFYNGLSEEQAKIRLEEQGENIISLKQKTPQILKFLRQVSDPFSLLLWFLAVLSFIQFMYFSDSNGLMLLIIVLIVILSGGLIQYIYNRNSQIQIQNLNEIVPNLCTVFRQKQQKIILTQKIVRGDIVVLEPNMLIPADLRIIECNGLRTNNSIFTGQSYLTSNTSQVTQQLNPFLSRNLIFSGATIDQGTGRGLVINTGLNKLITQIEDILEVQELKVNNIQLQIDRFVKGVTIFALGIGLFTFFGGWLTGFKIIIAAMLAIGVLIACVPGILNLQTTILFTMAVRKLSKMNVLVKSLHVIQSLGSTSCLCTDKTGTLTENKLNVSHLWKDGKYYKCDNKQDFGQDYIYDYNQKDLLFRQIQKCAILTSTAKFQVGPSKKQIQQIYSRTDLNKTQKDLEQSKLRNKYSTQTRVIKSKEKSINGSSVQAALLYFFQPIEDINITKNKNPYFQTKEQQVFQKTFSSQNKFSMSINIDQSNTKVIYTKGAPQVIWNLCKSVYHKGNIVPKQKFQSQFKKALQNFGKKGQKLLAFSHKQLDQQDQEKAFSLTRLNFNYQDQVFLGMISFMDPPRKGVSQTIQKLKIAGVKIVMITGDQQIIAKTIARQCNILTEQKTVDEVMTETGCTFEQAFLKSQAVVVTGEDIIKMMKDDQSRPKQERQKSLIAILQKKQVIFARTIPAHKMLIVEALQKMGHIVTVTGDGVNDSSALKISNAGICMGSGSQIAKDCADIIICDDDFNKILLGVQQGRKLFDNLKKAILYVMTSQIAQFMPFIVLIFTGIPIPVFTLLIDGPINFVLTVSFGYEEGQTGIMTRNSKLKQQHLVNTRLIAQASGWMGMSGFLCCLVCYYHVMIDFGFVPSNMWWKNSVPIVVPLQSDSYNPTMPTFGNSNLKDVTTCLQYYNKAVGADFINTSYPWVDFRLSSFDCKTNFNGSITFIPTLQYGQCRVQQISIYTNMPVCYTTQAAKYGQTAYMCGSIIDQVFNLFICRSRRQSCLSQRITNKIIMFGFTLQLMLVMALTNVWVLINLIGTRDNLFIHSGISAIPFGIFQITFDQIRKLLMRRLPKNDFGEQDKPQKQKQPNWFQRNTQW